MQCVVLAGGLGTRIRALTGDRPKSLFLIRGRPFIDYQLTNLKRAGITDVVLCIGYGGDLLRGFVKEGQSWGLSVRYVDEGSTLRGTAGAIRLALNQGVLDATFFVHYGDSYLPIDFRAIWAYFSTRNEKALMTVIQNRGQWDKSNARFDGQRVVLYDKSRAGIPEFDHIDYGLSVLRRDTLAADLPAKDPADLSVYFHKLSVEGQLAGMLMTERFFEIGSEAGIRDFQRMLEREQ